MGLRREMSFLSYFVMSFNPIQPRKGEEQNKRRVQCNAIIISSDLGRKKKGIILKVPYRHLISHRLSPSFNPKPIRLMDRQRRRGNSILLPIPEFPHSGQNLFYFLPISYPVPFTGINRKEGFECDFSRFPLNAGNS